MPNKKKNNSSLQVYNNSISQFVTGVAGCSKKQLSSYEGINNNLRYNLISQDRNLLQYLYANIGIVQTLIDQPVLDAYKKGFSIKSPEIDDDDLQKIVQFVKDNNIIATVIESRQWARLFGGGGMIVDIEGQEPSEPFNIDSINTDSKISFYAADLWQLNQTKIEPRGENVPYIAPVYNDDTPFLWYGNPLNRDRVWKLINKKAPNNIRLQLRGWGMSEVERTVRDLNNFFKSENVLYEVLDELKVTVHKISGLNDSFLSENATSNLITRMQALEQAKNYLNSVITDSENDIQQMQIDLSGLAQIMPEINKKIAAALKMPMTKLFGQNASGLNAGNDDLENYNSMIESEIRGKDDGMIIWMLRIISKKVLGYIPEIINLEFPSLRELKETEEQDVKDKKFNRARQMIDIGLWTEDQFNKYLEKENLL